MPGSELMPSPAARAGIKSSPAGCLTWGQSALEVWPLASLPGRVCVARCSATFVMESSSPLWAASPQTPPHTRPWSASLLSLQRFEVAVRYPSHSSRPSALLWPACLPSTLRLA